MDESLRIAQQMVQAFDAAAWHGPAVKEVLAGVDAQVATARPIANAHTIWEIVNHLISTQRTLLLRLDGNAPAHDLLPEQDWPPVDDDSEPAWQAAIRELTEKDREFRERVAQYPQEKLDEPLVPGGTSAYNNFHGYIQHNLYHTGQVALLKKAAG